MERTLNAASCNKPQKPAYFSASPEEAVVLQKGDCGYKRRRTLYQLIGQIASQDADWGFAVGGLQTLARDLQVLADSVEMRERGLATHWTDETMAEHLRWLAFRCDALAELEMRAHDAQKTGGQ